MFGWRRAVVDKGGMAGAAQGPFKDSDLNLT